MNNMIDLGDRVTVPAGRTDKLEGEVVDVDGGMVLVWFGEEDGCDYWFWTDEVEKALGHD